MASARKGGVDRGRPRPFVAVQRSRIARLIELAPLPFPGHVLDGTLMETGLAAQLCAERTYVPHLEKLGLWIPVPTD